MGGVFLWNQPWVQQTTPTPGSLRAVPFKGDLKHGGVVNRS